MNTTSRQNTDKFFLSYFNRSYPIDWPKEFGRKAPLIVEIGFGNGEYLVQSAQKNPDKDFVGIEINIHLIKKVLRRIKGTNVTNVRLLRLNAAVAFEYLFSPRSATQIYSLFPFPWPKKKHHRQRLFKNAFLKLVNNRLVQDGTFMIVTDDKKYFTWILKQNRATGLKAEKEIIPPKFNTRFERIWHEGGQNHFFQILFKKASHLRVPLKKEYPVEPILLKKFSPEKYAPKSITGPESIIFKKFIYDEKKKKGRQFIVIAEDNLTQRFSIFIERVRGGWRVECNPTDRIIKTKLVKKSLKKIIRACQAI
ncbi:MAG: tRNA (guanosine(46)-N7)-methyltransferase TrmB [Candidatus Omnitrophica bacterium]|nr:tRNA (guanosine(46)-N7)-methyltransferase TrmB [Candidatus Omnitrophota bacterium]